ncbi:MAG TPA: hypothetical protein DCW90_10915 [Lachnospiraceae bacterium]|nr:hypothetical protein [Lachnospiraceae bacterium]
MYTLLWQTEPFTISSHTFYLSVILQFTWEEYDKRVKMIEMVKEKKFMKNRIDKLVEGTKKMILFMKYSLTWKESELAEENYKENLKLVRSIANEMSVSSTKRKNRIFTKKDEGVTSLVKLAEQVADECEGITTLASCLKLEGKRLSKDKICQLEICMELAETIYHESVTVLAYGDLYAMERIHKEREKLDRIIKEENTKRCDDKGEYVQNSTIDFCSLGIRNHIVKLADKCIACIEQRQQSVYIPVFDQNHM